MSQSLPGLHRASVACCEESVVREYQIRPWLCCTPVAPDQVAFHAAPPRHHQPKTATVWTLYSIPAQAVGLLQSSPPDGSECLNEVHVFPRRGGHDLWGQAAAGAAVAAVMRAGRGVPVKAAAQLGQQLRGAVLHRAAVPAPPRRLLPRRRPQRPRIQIRPRAACTHTMHVTLTTFTDMKISEHVT